MKTQETKTQANQKTAQATDRIKQEAADLSEEAKAKAKARSTTENQKQEATNQFTGVAAALHQAATQFEQQHQDMLAYWTDQAAASLDKMDASLRDRDVETVLRQFQDFARRQPGVVLHRLLAGTGQQTEQPVDPSRPDNLFEPVPGDQGAHGPFDDRAKKRSWQLWMTTHRGWILLAGLVIIMVAFIGVMS